MIVLTHFHSNQLPLAQPLFESTKKNILREKIANLRQRTAMYKQCLDVVQQEQVGLAKHTITKIQEDQKKIAHEQNEINEQQVVLTQNLQKVKQNHLDIQRIQSFLLFTFSALLHHSHFIDRKQKLIKTDLTNIENNRQQILFRSIEIQQNLPIISQNLKQAQQKVELIEHQVERIQDAHQAIKNVVISIESKRDCIRDQIVKPVSDLFEQNQNHVNKTIKKIPIAESAGWLKKIQDFCVWMITTVCKLTFQLYQYVKIGLISQAL